LILTLGKWQDAVDRRLERWETQEFARRMKEKDPLLWHTEPQPEIADRLGWLELPERMKDRQEVILSFAHEIRQEGFSHVLLLGMGGSSLAPEVFQKIMGNAPGFPELVVLDSTHPAAIIEVKNKLNPSSTLILVSSKSGTTLETLSLFAYFWAWIGKYHRQPGRFFAAITDANSPLDKLGRKHKFRKIFLPSPDVGGRYSAFTEFGFVPAALIGMDIQDLLARARVASIEDLTPGREKNSPGLVLGASLGELSRKRDKLTLYTTGSLAGFPLWLEQLLAESTGKQGKGIVPVVDEPPAPAKVYAQDRTFVGFFARGDQNPILDKHFNDLDSSGHPTIRIHLKDRLEIGREIFRWEIATASAGSVQGIHPFNQPDVQLTKDLTRNVMEKGEKDGPSEQGPAPGFSLGNDSAGAAALDNFLSPAKSGGYIALQAFLPPFPGIQQALQGVRTALFKRTNLAITVGFGPRFLHSTGQLHKGGPDTVFAIQIIDQSSHDIPVPGTNYTFGALIEAQAWGDFRALQQKKRRAIRIALGRDLAAELKKLEEFIY
jgi:transaldolase/glucose-6-phosphate isomerase